MKVSPLEAKNKYGVLEIEETLESGPRPIDPWIVTYYAINFISKLHRRDMIRCCSCTSKNSTPQKTPKTFIRSATQEQDVMLTVGSKNVDMHAMIDVDALLDSGATSLFINCELVRNSGIATRVLEHPITVYNIDGTENKGGSIMEEVTMVMSYQGHKEKAVFEVCDLGKTKASNG